MTTIEHLKKKYVANNVSYEILKLRYNLGLSQREFAKLLKTTGSTICRLENPNYKGHTTKILYRIAEVFNKKLEIKFK